MKRSEINQEIKAAEEFFAKHNFKLPKFAQWNKEDWEACGEESEEIFDSIRQGHIAYVINTSSVGSPSSTSDGYQIRKYAIESNVTLFSSLDTVKVLLDVLEETTLCISTIDA